MNADRLFVAGALALCLGGAALAQPPRAPDPLAGLAKAVTVVMADSLVLVEDDHGVANNRTLKVGDEYRDGWKLTAVAGQTATLAKGNQTRVVTLGSTARPQAAASTGDTLVAAEKAALTNAVAGTRVRAPGQAGASGRTLLRPTGPVDPARLRAAVANGNVEDIYTLGGSAADVARALSANGGPMADMLAAGAQANFVNLNGRTGVQLSSGGEGGGPQRNMVMVPPQLQGAVPPTDAAPLNMPAIPPNATVRSDGQGNTIIRAPLPGGGQ